MKRTYLGLAVMAIIALLSLPAAAQDTARPDGWTTESHSNSADPNYAVVFPQDAVNTITITIAPSTWTAMMENMTAIAGEFGTRGGPGGMGGPEGAFDGTRRGGPDGMTPPEGMTPPDGWPEGMNPPEGMAPPEGWQEGMTPPEGMGQRGGGMGGMGGMGVGGGSLISENPMWVEADLTLNGETWTHIGFRFKGNSSLSGTWGQGIYKLPFKLDFDQYEDDYPEIDNQRFYGFKQLSFSSNWSDDSLLREKVTADVFRDAGLAAANTAFYAVYVDYGDGPVYFGLYTAVEVIDDTVIETQFSDGSGNVYKPEGNAATFAAGTFDEEELSKETNEKANDFSDVLALYNALNSDLRATDPAAWRAGLEAVFDVDVFLRWLATNTVAQNWDTYGQMAHNFYLYTNPENGLLTWIPWDNNMALGESFSRGPRGGSTNGSLSFDKSGVNEQWPLIRYLLDDATYYATYVAYLDEVSSGAFEPTKMAEIYTTYHNLIAPYVTTEQEGYSNLTSQRAFTASLDVLINHAQSRYTLTQAFVSAYNAQ